MAEVKIAADSGGGSVGLAGPATTTSNAAVQFKLPVADGSAGQVLKTDGSGNLSWYTLPTYTNGITEYDQWRINSNYSNSAGSAVITANWERADNNFEKIGTGLTESSGIFTFPSTGKYLITFNMYTNGNADRYIGGEIEISSDSGSNYSQIGSILDSAYDGSGTYSAASCSSLVDVTNTSTFRMRFQATSVGTVNFNGSTDSQRTGFTCIRLGDT